MGNAEAAKPNGRADDAALAARVRDGDTAAYTQVFETSYLPLVRFLMRYLTSREAAEDVAQDALLRLWEGRETIDPTRSLKAYLFTTARNRALDQVAHHYMARQRVEELGPALETDAEISIDPATDPSEALALDELVQMAEERVAALSPRLREVYHLSRHEGLTAAEIAQVLGTSVHTVYTQLTKITLALYPLLQSWLEG